MALTMTRTRTQTALTKLVECVAHINGELEFLDGLLAQEHQEEVRKNLLARQAKLQVDKTALFVTIQQFDQELEPEMIRSSDGWRKRFGSGQLTEKTLQMRYAEGEK